MAEKYQGNSGYGQTVVNVTDNSKFDPLTKELELRNESSSWDTSVIQSAGADDIPTIDLAPYLHSKSDRELEMTAIELREACEEVGFFSIVGHKTNTTVTERIFSAAKEFYALPAPAKNALLMDRPDWKLKGAGYMPFKNRKLPTRDKANLNEAFLIKRDYRTGFDDNQWPQEIELPGFREAVEQYAIQIEKLALDLLPIYATALGVEKTFFDSAFISPSWRLRMTHYPPVELKSCDEYGIAPHVDTTFLTILTQDNPGLVIFSERRQRWLKAPRLDDAFIVNSGELLKQWTNDRFISVKHFANNNTSSIPRYSIPFFFNANRDFTMKCIPTCCGPDNPERYPPLSYGQSQAVAQGE